jgi:hypothetical protein
MKVRHQRIIEFESSQNSEQVCEIGFSSFEHFQILARSKSEKSPISPWFTFGLMLKEPKSMDVACEQIERRQRQP